MHTSAQTVRGRSTLTDVEGQFRNGSVRELKTKRKEISTAINMNSNVTEMYLKEPLSITFHASTEEVGQLSRDKFRPMSSVHTDLHVGRKVPWRNSEALG